jgi:hypothetical protein
MLIFTQIGEEQAHLANCFDYTVPRPAVLLPTRPKPRSL